MARSTHLNGQQELGGWPLPAAGWQQRMRKRTLRCFDALFSQERLPAARPNLPFAVASKDKEKRHTPLPGDGFLWLLWGARTPARKSTKRLAV